MKIPKNPRFERLRGLGFVFALFALAGSGQKAHAEESPSYEVENPVEIEEELSEKLSISTYFLSPVTENQAALRPLPTPYAMTDPEVVILINKAAQGPGAQTLRIYERGTQTYEWPISTGRERKEFPPSGRRYFSSTPVGNFMPQKMVKNYFSRTWNAPMPNAVFFNGGIAIHGAAPAAIAQLGTRASGGCVRLHPDPAQRLFEIIKATSTGYMIPKTNLNKKTTSVDSRGRIILIPEVKTLILVRNGFFETEIDGLYPIPLD